MFGNCGGSGCERIDFDSTLPELSTCRFLPPWIQEPDTFILDSEQSSLPHLNSVHNLEILLDLQFLQDNFVFCANCICYYYCYCSCSWSHFIYPKWITAMRCTWETLEDHPEVSNDPECSSLSSYGRSLLCQCDNTIPFPVVIPDSQFTLVTCYIIFKKYFIF